LRVQKQSPAPTLFFGNLGFETTETSIRELLEAHRFIKKQGKDAPMEVVGDNKPKDIWIRKVRMGTFEDSGLCKGYFYFFLLILGLNEYSTFSFFNFLNSFAFVDFMTVEHATSALINPKNHQLNGRNLVVEYASPDAVRRGAPKGKSSDGPIAKDRRNRLPSRPYHDSRSNHSFSQPQEETSESANAGNNVPIADSDPVNHSLIPSTKKGDVRHKGPKTRPRPGAALALAKRESAAILPSQGHKITF
jgi:RNA recognition motif-containing protein